MSWPKEENYHVQDKRFYELKNLSVWGTSVLTNTRLALAVRHRTKGSARLGCYMCFLTSRSTRRASVPMWLQVKAEELQRRDYLAIHLQLSTVPPLLFSAALHLLLLTLHPQDSKAGRVVRRWACCKQMVKASNSRWTLKLLKIWYQIVNF